MPEAGQRPAEGLVEQDVLGRGGDPLLGSDDVGDLHEVVVDDVGQMIGGEAVGLEQDLVVDIVMGEDDGAAELVAEGGLALDGDFEADYAGAAFGLECGDLRGGEFAVRSVVTRGELGGDLRAAHGVQLFGGLEAAVGVAGCEQEIDVGAVDFGAFRLPVRTKGATDIGTLVPLQAEPAEGVEDHLLGGGDEACAVGILDAQDELAAALAGVEEVEQADVCRADVRVAGGRGCNADADGSGVGIRGGSHSWVNV